jgi:N-acetylglutamate synthase-like GNAT family acetyltransferase
LILTVKPAESYQARRATTDDLPQLLTLWRDAQFSIEELEKRFTDFHVAVDAEGVIGAAISLQISGQQACLNNETFFDFALTDTLRLLLWKHLQVVAQSYGLFLLWTREVAPFWRKDAGFIEAPPEVMVKLPAELGAPTRGWFALRLREEHAEPEALTAQFEAFKILERDKRDKIIRQARALRFLGTLLAAALFGWGLFLLFHFVRQRR